MTIKEQRPLGRIAVPVAATILTFSALGVCGTTAAQALPPRDGDGGSGVELPVRPTPAPAPAPAPSPVPVEAQVLPVPAPLPEPAPAAPVLANLETSVEEGVTKSGARRMSTTATYFPAEGRIVAQTRTWNSVKFSGFTGGVVVVFLNAQDQAIGYTTMRQFGVDGTWVGASSRTDFWQETVSAPWLSQATRIVAVHSHAHKGRLVSIVEEGVRAAKPILAIVGDVRAALPAK